MKSHVQVADIVVEVFNEYTENTLIAIYNKVFSECKPSNFFLSSNWIVNWIKVCTKLPNLVTFKQGSHLIGFAFLGKRTGLLGDTYFLNQTGNLSDDQMWIEFNDVISLNHVSECRHALLIFIENQANSYKFIAVNTHKENWQAGCWRSWSCQVIKGYETILSSETAMNHISRNSKSQISRSKKFIQSQFGGDIGTQIIQLEQLENAFAEMSNLHIAQWGKHELGSGFNNNQFVEFHRALLERTLNRQTCLLKFKAGDTTLGYLYYFVTDAKVYFYLSAIDYTIKENKYKPGIVMHSLAMEHFARQGFLSYDFLAGDARYKASLSNHEYELHIIHLFRNKWYYRPIRQMVSVKRWFIKTFLDK